jgi:hypothetical protein
VADTKVTALSAITTAVDADILYVVDDVAGTATSKKITRANLLKGIGTKVQFACSDEVTALTTGAAKTTFRIVGDHTLSEVRASVTTAPTGSAITIDVNESGTTIFSTELTIDATEYTSTTAATPAVIDAPALADDAEITVDIEAIGSTIAGAGLKVVLIGTET